MKAQPKTLVIIPARGGSKGLPRKNIIDLGGVPLIAWSIVAAQQAPSVTDIIVSTDEEEIAEVAKEWGAEVPFLRPKELAGDRSLVADAISYTLANLDEEFDSIVSLFPTHPFRTPSLIEEAIRISQSRSLGVASATSEAHYAGDFVLFGEGEPQIVQGQPLRPILRQHAVITISTRFPKAVYQTRGREHYKALTDAIRQGDERFLTPEHYLCVDDPVLHTDIDTPEDLKRARELLREKKVLWTPKEGYTTSKTSFVERSFEHSSSTYPCYLKDSLEKVSVALENNPLGMTPSAVRIELDKHASLRGRETIVLVGQTNTTTNHDISALKFPTSDKPLILATKAEPLHLGSGTACPTIGFGYLFVDEQLVETVGSFVGDVPANSVNRRLQLDLSSFAESSTSFVARAFNKDLGLLAVSSKYEFRANSWSPAKQAHSTLHYDSNTSVLHVPEDTMAVDMHVFREGSVQAKRGYSWAPLEFPGLLEHDSLSSVFTNRLSDTTVARRQDLPPIHRWKGYAFLPASVSSEASWGLSWSDDENSQVKAE